MRFHILFLSSILLIPSAVLAQSSSSDAARSYFESGTHAFEARQWLDCAHDFERSFEIVFAPELLYNIGLCYQRASSALPDAEASPLLDRSLSAYRRYLRELPDADPTTVQRDIDDLQARLDRITAAAAEAAPEPEIAPEEPEVAPVVDDDPEPSLTFEQVQRNQYPVTILAGALTLVSSVIAIGLGLHAQDLYNGLMATCARTDAGCSTDSINEVSTFSLASNIMYGASGVFLVGTGIGFGMEFTATEARPTSAMLTVSGRF